MNSYANSTVAIEYAEAHSSELIRQARLANGHVKVCQENQTDWLLILRGLFHAIRKWNNLKPNRSTMIISERSSIQMNAGLNA